MTSMSCDRHNSRAAVIGALLVAALLLTPASVAHAGATVGQAVAPDGTKDGIGIGTAGKVAPAGGSLAPVAPPTPAPQQSFTSKTIDKVKEVAKAANDIFNRVPCLPPVGGVKSIGSLPHVVNKLATGQPL